MHKAIVFVGSLLLCIGLSCALMEKDWGHSEEESSFIEASLPKEKIKLSENPGAKEQSNIPKNSESIAPDSPKNIFQYDSVGLDEKVRAEAQKFNQDPQNYRMHIRTDPDGAKVYRMLGMHVIVSPMGEETFLPDEI